MTRTTSSSHSSSPLSSTSTTNSPTKKPAVIISEDGEIEQRVENTHEFSYTAPDVTTEVNSPITPGTDIVLLPGEYTVTEVYKQTPQRKLSRYTIYLLGAFIVSAILLIYYFKSEVTNTLIASDNTATIEKKINENLNEIDNKTPANNSRNAINALKLIANLIIQDDVDDVGLIDSFLNQWHQLKDDEKQEFSNTFWYKRFSGLLLEKVNTGNDSETVKSAAELNYDNALLKMASIMGIEIPDNSIVDDPNLNLEADFENIFKEISSEIAKAELDKKKALDENTVANDQAIEEVKKTSTQGFSEPDINYLLGRYATTYEFGSTEKLLELFSDKGKYKSDLKRNFNRVFSYSSNRNVEFSDLSWDFQESSIIGNGKYSAKIVLNNDKGTRFVKANIQIIMGVKNKQLRITKLNFMDIKVTRIKAPRSAKKKISALKPAAKVKRGQKPVANTIVAKTTKIVTPNRSTKPTAAELQDVVTRFIGAYQSGNLAILDSIFDSNAKTNDRVSLRDIKQDYRSLFANTADRQLFIQNIKWTYKNNQAEGIGMLSTLIVPTGSNKATAQQGEIHIVATKTKNKVLITKLYHNINDH